jgi:hypothetical protein
MAFSPFQNQDSPNEVNAPKVAPPAVGQPFKRYIGRDEVQKRAQSFNSFTRPPVVAPPQNPPAAPVAPVVPGQNGGINPGGNSFQGNAIPRPVNPGFRAPVPDVTGGGGGVRMPAPVAPVQPGNLMPVVRPQTPQFSLANRGWSM